ncbi:galactose-1-epimerase [Fulvivirga sp. M361]|uniref:aldose epimerase family protein n=1 Tax=Fulvivirga sp. M361 TaxID=2594266 RepID=UPI00117B8BBF|nr:galactose-1-epimerase [Fulvivirga sp. M361]TRX62034.1 galactose-1-epimerase [Fulvivirga sp. M361]
MRYRNIHIVSLIIGSFLLINLITSCTSSADPLTGSKPNIIIIMADDLGYSDLGCYGSEIKTPNLDRLAAGGLKFTQFYNAGRCSPSRAALLTGLHPHKAGVAWLTTEPSGNTAPGYRGNLNDQCVTIPEVLKKSGYTSYISGKWHVTEKKLMESSTPVASWPNQRGFAQFFGTINGLADFFTPVDLKRNNNSISYPEGFYYTDAISDTAVSFISSHAKTQPEDPFFLYVAYTAPHFPLQAKPEDIVKYEHTYLSGWDEVRKQRFERMKKLGVIDAEASLIGRDAEVTAWKNLDEAKKKEMTQRMAVYAAQVDCMDQGIGRILLSLEQNGQLDNTLIFFLSDNGASAEYKSELDPDPALLGTAGSYESYRMAWAHVSNTPFSRYKHWVHEGGISSPLIVSWPAIVKDKGKWVHDPAHIVDLMATSMDVAGARYPEEFEGRPIHPYDGLSLSPVLQGRLLGRDTLYWEHEGNRAIRIGNWKLVSRGKPLAPYYGEWKLFNLGKDRSEQKDRAAEFPEKVKTMADVWHHWGERSDVFPLDGRAGKARRYVSDYAIDQEKFGAMPDGRQVHLYTLKNYDGVQVKITNYGGIITRILTPDKNQFYKDIVLGFDTLEEYLTKNGPHFGALIGRYANRIAYGKFELDGKTYDLPKNRPPHHLHSGDRKGFDRILWDAEIVEEDHQEKLRLTYTSPDGNEGYPGNLDTRVDYYLTNNNELVIDYLAKTDKPTIVNLTNHSYFNLSGQDTKQFREYGPDLEKYLQIMDHTIYINADSYTPIGASLIPTGEVLPVKGTKFDFTESKVIEQADPAGYDHNFVLNKSTRYELALAAIIHDPKTGRTMEVHTTQPGLQFYTGNFLSDKIKGKKGRSLTEHAAFCLETQNFPDAPNHKNFPSPVLRPGEVYEHKTIYRFDVRTE